VWGPAPGRTIQEQFAGLPGNSHLVQYFDKGRMELNNPNANPNDPFFVTNGLLTVDLISGLMQTGAAEFERRSPAAIPLASDADDPSAPTYQSFNGVASIPGAAGNRRAESRVSQTVRTAIDRQGVTQPWPQDHPDYGVRIAHYEPATGHNVPDVFWEYLNQQTDIIQGGQAVKGPLFFPWFAVSGYPISEPYWAYVKVAGRYTDVLIQAFERRVLTYVPHLPSPFKVQMGNIGQHYFEWRYLNTGQPTPPARVPTPTSPVLPPRAAITIDGISYRTALTDINGTYATLTNRGQTPQVFNGWWLDSPKWSFVDRFQFPNGVTLQPGASIRVRSGPGVNSATDIYMFRTSVMWDQRLYDLAVLYDNFGREVDRFFPAADVGVTPTAPPGATATRPPAGTPQTTGTTAPTRTGTQPTATRTPTGGIPSPVSTGVATSTPRPSGSPSTTTSPGATATGATATPTPTVGAGGCPEVDPSRKAIQADDGAVMIYDVDYRDESENVDVFNYTEDDLDMSGWVLRDKNNTSTSYTFPNGAVNAAGDSIFVYTAPGHTYTFGRQTPIWDDCGAALHLLDSTGELRATFGYGNHLLEEP
jgi:hypothetical protein